MSKVFFDVGISLDGFIAGPNGGTTNPLGDGGIAIHDWMFRQKSFLEHLGMEGGEENNTDNDIITDTIKRIGANIMGKNMFVEGEISWPEEAPFHTPVFVLTKEPRNPWKRKGGTTFYFVNEEIEKVLSKAKDAAGQKDVRISGGADVIRQYLNAGLIDEFIIHIAPLFLGTGVRLFEKTDNRKVSFEISKVVGSPLVTHISYNVKNKVKNSK
ncbi:MAG TPA: dihydrofolate reductase family protein [Ignavibacteriaceae bacterium]|nr:dihydrofolate reductase family protein [Ignavibacteriaceae bacterium]